MALDGKMPVLGRRHERNVPPTQKTNGLRLGHWLLFVIGVSFLLDASMRARLSSNTISSVQSGLRGRRCPIRSCGWRLKAGAKSQPPVRSRFDAPSKEQVRFQ